MDSLALIVCIAFVIGLFTYVMFKLENGHGLLKLFFFFAVIFLILLLPKIAIDESSYCEILTNTTTLTANTTAYTYERVCFTNTKTTANTFLSSIVWAQRIIITYMILYLAFTALKFLGFVVPRENASKKIIKFKFRKNRRR